MEKSSEKLFSLPFVRIAPFMAAGMLLAYFGGSGVCAIIFVCAAAFVVYSAAKRRPAWCAVGLAAGLLVCGLYTRLYCAPILEFSGKTVYGELTVREVTRVSGDSERVTAVMSLDGRTVKVSLTCENELTVGQRAAARIELGEYDEEKLLYNLANGILLSGTAEEIELLPGNFSGTGFLRELRNGLIGSVERTVFGDSRALLLAMTFGEDSRLSQAMREQLKICGAAHFTAVSGAHFAVFGAVLMQLIPKTRRKLRATFPLVFAPLAVVFFGTSASVLRAAAMFFMGGLAALFRRKNETLNTLCAAFTLIALCSPGIILDAGFAMSVLGVLGVGAVGPKISERICRHIPQKAAFLKAPLTAVTVSVSAVICTSPISAALFKGVSLFGAVSSILLMALMTVGTGFAIIGGVTGSALLAVPAPYAMRAAEYIIEFFGSCRELWLPLNFDGAWLIAALCAVMLILCAYASPKTVKLSACCIAALSVFSVLMSLRTVELQSEIRFVGTSRSCAAVVISKDTAAVVISGTGAGIAEKVSQCLREHGVKKISILMAENADFTGALAVKELSELIETEKIYSTPTAAMLLGGDVEIISKDSVLNAGGITIAAAEYSESNINADIAVYSGSFRSVPQSSAGLAVYFSNFDRELPENGVNAVRDKELSVKLPNSENLEMTVVTLGQ